MTKVFEQQPKESGKAFGAFSVYLNLGEQRSLEAAAKQLGKSKTLLERWSRKFDWASRVLAHGSHLAIVEREATEASVRGKAAVWLSRREKVLDREWDLHEKAILAAERGLKAFMEREKVYANLSDIARMLEVASKLGRLATGLSERNEQEAKEPPQVRVEVLVALEKIYGQAEPVPTLGNGAGTIDVQATRIGGQG